MLLQDELQFLRVRSVKQELMVSARGSPILYSSEVPYEQEGSNGAGTLLQSTLVRMASEHP